MTVYTYDEQVLSDLYKDCYGCRPREQFWFEWDAMSQDERQTVWDGMIREVEDVIDRENKQYEAAWVNFNKNLDSLMSQFNIDRATALRWDVESHDLTITNEMDIGLYCYNWGLSYIRENEVLAILKA